MIEYVGVCLVVLVMAVGCTPSEERGQSTSDTLAEVLSNHQATPLNNKESQMNWGKLDAEVVEPHAGSADAVVIWLHGLGASGHDFLPLAAQFQALNEHLGRVRFVFPHAPKIPVTINGGIVMPAWYDLTAIRPKRSMAMPTFDASVTAIQQMVRQEMAKGIASTRIFLAGFSQGGVVAYQAGLTFEYSLAGVLALSSYLAEPDALVVHSNNANTPLLVMHGTQDDVVDVALGRQAHQALLNKGLPVEMKEYPMAHQVIAEQLMPIALWLTAGLQRH